MYDNILEAGLLHFPPYLTPGDRHKLFEELRQFPENFDYYWNTQGHTTLQGDGFTGFLYLFGAPGPIRQKSITGIVVSNSCDVAPENNPNEHQNVLFAPVVSMEKYLDRYRATGNKSDRQIESLITTIRQQKVTSLFYLPSFGDQLQESIVPLDEIRPEPLSYFLENKGDRIFRLSQYGFWIFLIKLSIHFTRMQEGVRRFPE